MAVRGTQLRLLGTPASSLGMLREKAGEGGAVVDVEDDALFIDRDFDHFGGVGPDDGAGADFVGGSDELVVEMAREEDRMTAAPVPIRQDDGAWRTIERFD